MTCDHWMLSNICDTNLSCLWDCVLHDASYVSNGQVDVLLSEIVFATIAIFMVMKTFLTII